jgi:fructokinase
MLKIGIDLGGTKIEIIALGDGGGELLRRRVATPAHEYAVILETIGELVQSAERDIGEPGSVGVGAPGAVSTATGRLKNSNTACLNGKPLKQDLEKQLGREIRLANDANCFALSESVDGAGAGASVVFGVILGTGVGGGIVVNGRILEGANSIAGEWGHNRLPSADSGELPGPLCYCGRHGCVETWLSGSGLARDHAAHGGRAVSAEVIATAALAGEAVAKASLARYQDRLARSLAHVINILDPDVVVLGGGLSNIDALYSGLPALLAPHVFSDEVVTRIVQHQHGDSSGARGAAWLWGR